MRIQLLIIEKLPAYDVFLDQCNQATAYSPGSSGSPQTHLRSTGRRVYEFRILLPTTAYILLDNSAVDCNASTR